MKIVYCNHSVYNPGGMERVMINKIHYLVETMHWDVVVVTTDQKGRPPFYPLPQGVRLVDLGVNYSDDNGKNTFLKIAGYLRRRSIHKKRLTKLLNEEKPDILVSLYPSESSFMPDLKDGSKKLLELHFNKFFRLQYGRTGLYGIINKWRTKQDEKLVRKFDKFVVLTEEDKSYWGDIPNIMVIPNAAIQMRNGEYSDTASNKRVIAVGRLDYQKGLDRLIDAWHLVQQEEDFRDWHLDIFGKGEWESMLKGMIDQYGLADTVCINSPTKDIAAEYKKSSMLVMSSHYEGFPMVMIEAMSMGLPVVSYDFKCGPRDIIDNGNNGLVVREGDVVSLAESMMKLMRDASLRSSMGVEARKVTERYSEGKVMGMWVELFESLAK